MRICVPSGSVAQSISTPAAFASSSSFPSPSPSPSGAPPSFRCLDDGLCSARMGFRESGDSTITFTGCCYWLTPSGEEPLAFGADPCRDGGSLRCCPGVPGTAAAACLAASRAASSRRFLCSWRLASKRARAASRSSMVWKNLGYFPLAVVDVRTLAMLAEGPTLERSAEAVGPSTRSPAAARGPDPVPDPGLGSESSSCPLDSRSPACCRCEAARVSRASPAAARCLGAGVHTSPRLWPRDTASAARFFTSSVVTPEAGSRARPRSASTSRSTAWCRYSGIIRAGSPLCLASSRRRSSSSRLRTAVSSARRSWAGVRRRSQSKGPDADGSASGPARSNPGWPSWGRSRFTIGVVPSTHRGMGCLATFRP
jgi:hypothetical protein